MANASLYVNSMQALSTALEKAMLLTHVRQQIRTVYATIWDESTNDQKVAFDAFIRTWPQIQQLNEREKEVKNEFAEYLGKSTCLVLDFILTLGKDDLNDSSITGLQKHLQLLHGVITAQYTDDKGLLKVDKERIEKSLDRLDSFSDSPQLENVKLKVKQLAEDLDT